MTFDNRESIKNRMLKHVNQVWNHPASDSAVSYDPIVQLLLDVLASELAQLSFSYKNADNRITEEIAALLLPEQELGALPAYGVMHVTPTDEILEITPHQQFVAVDNPPGTNQSIFVSTIINQPVYPLKLQVLINSGMVLQLNKHWQYETYTRLQPMSLGPNIVYLGVEVCNKDSFLHSNRPLKGLTICFNSSNEKLYEYLSWLQVSIGKESISYKRGLHFENSNYVREGNNNIISHKQELQPENSDYIHEGNNYLPQNSCHYNKYIDRTIKRVNKHYITITDERPLAGLINADTREAEHLDIPNLQQPAFWLKLHFPENIEPDLVENMVCNINCIPVINVKLEEQVIKTNPLMNIIPLESNSQFFAVISLQDDQNKAFKEITQKSYLSLDAHEMTLRSNIVHHNERSVIAQIDRLVDIIKSEQIIFTLGRRENILSQLETLQQTISAIEKQISEANNKVPSVHLIAKSPPHAKYLTVKYCSTDGAQVTNTKKGSRFREYNTSHFQSSSIMLFSNLTGGRAQLSPSRKVDHFRFQLLSRDRIVTISDVELLCKKIAGEIAKKVIVSIGTSILPGNSGYSRCINIDIHYDIAREVNKDRIKLMEEEIRFELEEKACGVFPYNVRFIGG